MEEKNKKVIDQGKAPSLKISRLGFCKLQVMFAETFGLSPGVTLTAVIFTALVVIVAVC